jgi:Tfp pilus assembly protein PilV
MKYMYAVNWLKKRMDIDSEPGISMIEAVVSVALLGLVILMMVIGMSGGALAVSTTDEQSIAQGLARSQMEYTKNYTYNASATTYPKITAPSGYTITVNVTAVPDTDNNIQKITVTITRNGETLETLEDYKVNR